mgnify:CR=1 FL=1
MEEAADAAHSIQVERAALLCLRRSRYAAERAVCACLKRLVSEASGPRVSGCLPRANLRSSPRASCED